MPLARSVAQKRKPYKRAGMACAGSHQAATHPPDKALQSSRTLPAGTASLAPCSTPALSAGGYA
eukprot:350246-Chlamydomonas_euryale.AAC.1